MSIVEDAEAELEASPASTSCSASEASEPTQNHEPPTTKNFWLLVIYQVTVRVGWIFKTESIVMPAVLDLTGAGAWLRACLPALNRFGQTIPPLLFSTRLSRISLKKRVLATTTLAMGICFLVLATTWGIWIIDAVPMWFGWMFLACYGLFFIATGLNQITFGTVQGKLVAPTKRGSLLLLSNVVGVTLATLSVATLLPLWLTSENGQFHWIFGFTGVCFLVAGALVLLLDEQRDLPAEPEQAKANLLEPITQAITALRSDATLRQVAIVGASLGTSFMLFPHYQAIAREKLGLGMEQLVLWLIVQNVGTAIFSVPAGWVADRHGNRVVIRVAMAMILAGPILAWGFSHWGLSAPWMFASVFFFVGLTPVSLRLLSNYTLELTASERHPTYLGCLGLCLGLPTMLLSPLFGVLIDWAGFDVGFGLITASLLVGWATTWFIAEPRRDS